MTEAPQGGYQPDLVPVPEVERRRNVLAVLALVLGLVAVGAGVHPGALFVALPAGVAALVLGLLGIVRAGRGGAGRGPAVGGLALGALALLLVGGWLLVLLTEPDFQDGFVEGFREALRDEGGVFTLQAGQCFDFPEDPGDVASVPLVPCDGPHQYEVFGRVAHPALPGEAFPGAEVLVEHALERCAEEHFAGYVGVPAERSRYAIDVIHPDAGSWRLGERTLICVLHDPVGGDMDAPAEGSRR